MNADARPPHTSPTTCLQKSNNDTPPHIPPSFLCQRKMAKLLVGDSAGVDTLHAVLASPPQSAYRHDCGLQIR
ncbi:hypothetical protein [Segatella baroniae]|uniref:hypothetical protein n=1 Tax=Segatella baroniae TaxID=305719 RepID=UPI0012DC9D80|nr:hypothetical protein [Segatella baroniae]